jgi:pimeloyl-ACP methyl ester carboxylesterase
MTNAGERIPGWKRVGRGRLRRKLADLGMSALAVLIISGLHGAMCTGSAAAGPPAATASPDLERELGRRQDELVRDDFTFTQSMTLGAKPYRLELLIPPGDAEHKIALWFAAEHGDASVRWLDPAGEVVTASRGRRIEQRLTRALAPGKHVVEIQASGGRVHGLVAVHGPLVKQCEIDAARMTEHPADPAHGFAWPYLLVAARPAAPDAHGAAGPTTLLVVPPNTGFATDDLDLLRASTTCYVADQLAVAERLGTPIVAPLFPRPALPSPPGNLYLHALSRASLEVRDARLARVDLQLIAMLDDARQRLATADHPVQPRVLLIGHSAAGMFVSRFAVLHPDRVLAAAVSSPGGWPLAPVASAQGEALPYPVGIADVAALTGAPVDLAALRRVRWLFVLGGADRNDSVTDRDSFSAADEALVMRRFGKTPAERWDAARRLSDAAGLPAQFRLYRGVGHEMSPAMKADIEALFRAALAAR